MTTIVSYSEVSKVQTCERQHHYRFNLGLSPIEESAAIMTGVKGHKLLQTFYELLKEGWDKEDARKHVHEQATKMSKNGNTIDFSLLKAWTLVDNFIREAVFTAEAILIENRFLVPANKLIGYVEGLDLDNVQIGFTPDVVLQRKGNFIDIDDAKFVGRAWSQKKLNHFPQSKLYQLFMEAMGYTISRTQIRFFNTTTAAITTKSYVMKPAEKITLMHDFMQGVKRVVEIRNKNAYDQALAPRTMNYTACDYCPFDFPCTLEAEGKDATRTLESLYTVSKYDYNN